MVIDLISFRKDAFDYNQIKAKNKILPNSSIFVNIRMTVLK